jgi:nickel-dependent lactate racemase
MRVGIDYAQEHLELDVPESELIEVHREPPAPPLLDPAAAVRASLETPLGFPALRRALTPDDHVVIVYDESLPRLPELLAPVLEHVAQAHVSPAAITLLCSQSLSSQQWLQELPEAFRGIHVEVHDPTDRRHLSYLATTRQGRRLYLNRTAVDADQLVVLARRRFDPLLGYSGAAGALYPALSDEATRKELWGRLTLAVPGDKPWPVRREAEEVAWLLGAPFMVHVIEGAADSLTHVVSGLAETGNEGLRLLNARWRVQVKAPLADIVIASLTGDARRHTFADMAAALACAARVVKPQGRIVLLTRAEPGLAAGADMLREAEMPAEALEQLHRSLPADMAAAFQWASAAGQASIYLLSGLPAETAEELFATPLDHAGQAQRLVGSGKSCLFLTDAHKTMAVAVQGSHAAA